ncbi:4Fe-4S dicluster domain-containing protein [bacterium]|nr:4Fe-4S dicluster domain-containing protein [bacterium]
MRMSVKDRLATNKTKLSKKPHIVVETEICDTICKHHCTTRVCPAKCFEIIEDKMQFQYEDCIECGTCLHACDQGAVSWAFPESGHGITFRLG